MSDRKFSFGYREVGPEEKRGLVGATFDQVAPAYDRANRVFSLGFDAHWRRKAIRLLGLRPGDRVLDVCGGTGQLAVEALRRTGPDGLAIVLDMNAAMLEVGRRKRSSRAGALGRFRPGEQAAGCGVLHWVLGNAEALPLPDSSVHAVTVGFGLRNIVHLEAAFSEAARVLRPGGGFAAIEFGLPRNPFLRRLYDDYAFRIMPFAAGLLFRAGEPFRYLAESIRVFQAPERTIEMLGSAGLTRVRFLRLTAGVAVIFLARKPN